MRAGTSISGRIARLVVLGVGLGIAAGVGIFLLYDFQQALKLEKSRYESAAYAFAAAASDAVATHDRRKTLEVLRGVRELPEIVYISAKTSDGKLIAEIGTGASLVSISTTNLIGDFFPNTLNAKVEVKKSGQTVGWLELQAQTAGLRARYVDALFLSGSIGLFLVIATALISRMQVVRILNPLRSLAAEFQDIGRRNDLRRRLEKERDDEVGVLVDAFNEMFGHIYDRDKQLQSYREGLEETIHERTADLRIAKEDAEFANAAKSDFLATMSHEIRTPMNGMMVMAEMLAAAPLAPRHLRYAEIITRSGKNLLHIINDILDFSKIESGKIDLESIEFSLDGVIEDVACLFAERAREKGLTLAVHISPEAPARVYGDPTRLTQIISNLVNNGLKFTSEGGVTISTSSKASGEIVVAVEDTGIGIASEQMNRIFSRFSQADTSISRKFGGTGLGLSISKQLCELMGGSIAVESEVGSGSRFILTIPLEIAQEAGRIASAPNASILLLESDQVSRRALEKSLHERNIRVLRSDSADRPDVVLLRCGEQLTTDLDVSGIPIISLRPFAATTANLPDGVVPIHELSLPLSRSNLDLLQAALSTGDFAAFDARKGTTALKIRPDLSNLRVLAVDDIAVNREVLSEALKTFNITCELAESGPDAISKLRDKAYDVIFMDCSMPGMDGFEATGIIRAEEQQQTRPSSYIVALTGNIMGKDSGLWRKAGMNAYLAKPFTIEQLDGVFGGISTSTTPIDEDSAPAIRHAPAQPDFEDDPLFSEDSMRMFDVVMQTTGNDIKAKVFSLFTATASTALAAALTEIRESGSRSKELIHALKSNCSSAGAHRAMLYCDHIERIISTGRHPEEVLLETLAVTISDTIKAMEDTNGSPEDKDNSSGDAGFMISPASMAK